jgi:hypothetical protein
MIKLTKFRVIEISAAVVLTLAALVILGWQAWAGGAGLAGGEKQPLSLATSRNGTGLTKSQQ